MKKMLVFITSVTCLIVPVLSKYEGDSCRDRDNQGTCIPLSQCQSLIEEIRAAGSPMPMHIRNRLEDLGCGFTYDEPLVCCAPADTDIINPDRRDKDGQDEGPPNVTNHPNLKLLPRACGTIDSNRILGGNRTALYEMPWMVILSYDDDGITKQSCGGTLINERYVLTAAHCIQLGSRMTLNGAILGEYDIRSDPDCEVIAQKTSCAPGIVNATIEEIIPHPGYRRQTLFDDIALLRLSEPADFNMDNIGAICLPTTRSLQSDNLDGLNGVVAGWGLAEDKIPSPVLMSVSLPIIPNDECQAAYRGTPRLYKKQLCAGGLRDKDSCGGDSGGPLLYPGNLGSGGVRYVQRGVVSFGPKRCGVGGLPGVYTRVSHYMKWILDNMRR